MNSESKVVTNIKSHFHSNLRAAVELREQSDG